MSRIRLNPTSSWRLKTSAASKICEKTAITAILAHALRIRNGRSGSIDPFAQESPNALILHGFGGFFDLQNLYHGIRASQALFQERHLCGKNAGSDALK